MAGRIAGILLLFMTGAARAFEPVDFVTADGRSAADFTLMDANGIEISLSSHEAGTVIVHFFATWCEPCRDELPALDRLARRDGAGIAVIAISVAEPPPRVRRFFEGQPVAYAVLLDEDRQVARTWEVSALPTSFVLDADHAVRRVARGPVDWDLFDAASRIDGSEEVSPGDNREEEG